MAETNNLYSTLYDIATDVEAPTGLLEETVEALQLWHEKIEHSGYQVPEKMETWKAELFIKNEFSAFLTMHRILIRELSQQAERLRKISDELYEKAFANKTKAAE